MSEWRENVKVMVAAQQAQAFSRMADAQERVANAQAEESQARAEAARAQAERERAAAAREREEAEWQKLLEKQEVEAQVLRTVLQRLSPADIEALELAAFSGSVRYQQCNVSAVRSLFVDTGRKLTDADLEYRIAAYRTDCTWGLDADLEFYSNHRKRTHLRQISKLGWELHPGLIWAAYPTEFLDWVVAQGRESAFGQAGTASLEKEYIEYCYQSAKDSKKHPPVVSAGRDYLTIAEVQQAAQQKINDLANNLNSLNESTVRKEAMEYWIKLKIQLALYYEIADFEARAELLAEKATEARKRARDEKLRFWGVVAVVALLISLGAYWAYYANVVVPEREHQEQIEAEQQRIRYEQQRKQDELERQQAIQQDEERRAQRRAEQLVLEQELSERREAQAAAQAKQREAALAQQQVQIQRERERLEATTRTGPAQAPNATRETQPGWSSHNECSQNWPADQAQPGCVHGPNGWKPLGR
jgi:hypothetical protein